MAALNGKILRFNDDGTSAAGNRFSSPVFTFGHRNPQGLAWHPATGDLWETEHGQVGNDEINVIDGGNNYGWPVIEGDATRPDMSRRREFFTPSVAPSGADFTLGTAIPAFRNQLFVATLAATGAAARHYRRHRLPARRIRSGCWRDKYGRLRDVVRTARRVSLYLARATATDVTRPSRKTTDCMQNRARTLTDEDEGPGTTLPSSLVLLSSSFAMRPGRRGGSSRAG